MKISVKIDRLYYYFLLSIWAAVSEPTRQETFASALAAAAQAGPPPRHGALARSVPGVQLAPVVETQTRRRVLRPASPHSIALHGDQSAHSVQRSVRSVEEAVTRAVTNRATWALTWNV